jgi:hypothetical protein
MQARRSVISLAALIRCLRQSNGNNNSMFLLERTAQGNGGGRRGTRNMGRWRQAASPPLAVSCVRFKDKSSFKAQLQSDAATEAPVSSLARAPIAPLDTSP